MQQAVEAFIDNASAFLVPLDGAFNTPWNALFTTPKTGSPIILDLDGDGVSTTSINAGTYFDLRNTGHSELTGWAAPTDGLLAWDRNGNGLIDNGGELFGNFTQKADGTIAKNGFEALASYDSNADGKIDASDAIWNDLKLWVDANGNAITDTGETHALSDYGVQSLKLAYTDRGSYNINYVDDNGNYQQCAGAYTKTDGSTQAMNDVFFVDDSTQTLPGTWVATTAAIDALPDLQSQGVLDSLHQAMAKDASGALEALVTQFTNATTIDARNALMEQILIAWAGAQNVDPATRNLNNARFNAQHLAVLEAAMGRPFHWDIAGNQLPNQNDPMPQSVAQLTSAYKLFFERMYAQLAAQTYLKPAFDLITTVTDSDGTRFDFTGALNSLFGSSMTHDNVVEFYRAVFASGLLDTQVNYAGLLSALEAQAPQYVAEVNQIVAPYYASNLTTPMVVNGITYSVDPLYAPRDGATVVGGLGDDVIMANANNLGDVRSTTVYGNAGNDTIYAVGNSSNTASAHDLGVSKVYGGTGNDTIHYVGYAQSGAVIDGGAGDNTLRLDGSTYVDVSLADITNVQSLVVVTSGAALLTADQFNAFDSISSAGTWGKIELSTGGTCSLADKGGSGISELSAQGAAGDFILTGNDEDGQVLVGGLGTNVLTAGNGSNCVLRSGSMYGGTGNSTLNGGDGTGTILYAGSANDTLNAGAGGTRFYDGTGIDIMNGGSGDDTFNVSHAKAGSTITGGGGSDTLHVGLADITGFNISGVDTLDAGSYLKLTLAQFSAFTTLKNGTSGSSVYRSTLKVADEGTFDLTTKSVTGIFDLDASASSANMTLIGNDQDNQILKGGSGTCVLTAGDGDGVKLYGGSGTTTMTAGSGVGDHLYAGSGATTMNAGSGGNFLHDGSGVDIMNGGTGDDTFYIAYAKAGSTVTGGGGSDTLYVTASDITGLSVSGVGTLDERSSSLKLTNTQFSGFSALISNVATGSGRTLYAMDGGTYDLSGKTVTNNFSLDASKTSANVTLIGNDQDGQILKGGSGACVLTAGDGDGVILYGGTGNATMNVGTGDETLNGGKGYNTYNFGSDFGQDVINNGYSGTTVAKGEINFTSATVTDENLWFSKSGSDLIVTLLGTTDTIKVKGWYGSNAGAKVQSFTADGLTLDSQVAQLVQAMSAYQSTHTGFNPTTSTAMPTDTTLQNAIAASWHS